MDRLSVLRSKIKELYDQKDPNRAAWADWLAEHHVFVAATYAEQLTERFGVQPELAPAAAMLHDIADTVMERENPQHEEKSFEIARTLLDDSGFSDEEKAVIVDDAIRFHSCKAGRLPKTEVGKVMASADALAHLCTGFYDFGIATMLQRGESREDIKRWGVEKIDRDYYRKLFFDDVREEIKDDFNRVKELFEAL